MARNRRWRTPDQHSPVRPSSPVCPCCTQGTSFAQRRSDWRHFTVLLSLLFLYFQLVWIMETIWQVSRVQEWNSNVLCCFSNFHVECLTYVITFNCSCCMWHRACIFHTKLVLIMESKNGFVIIFLRCPVCELLIYPCHLFKTLHAPCIFL